MWTHQPLGDWIDAVCRQYTHITGHALRFDAAHEGAQSGSDGLTVDSRAQWRATICDGTQTVGTLRLTLPAGHIRDAEYLRACETAELTAQLIERVLTTQAGEHTVADDGPPRPSALASRGRAHQGAAGCETTKQQQTPERIERLLDVLLRLTDFPAAAFLVVGADGPSGQLTATRSSGVWTPSADDLLRCHERLVSETDLGSTPRIVRRGNNAGQEHSVLPAGVATGIAQRVGREGDVHGVLWVFDRRDRRATARDRHIIASVAERLQLLLEQATLLDHSSHSRQVRAELRIASQSQPSSEIEYVGPGGWCQLAGRMQSQREIGGDLMEVIPLANERLFLAIGDAAGHSIPAAMVMANVRGAIRALFDGSRDESGRPQGLPPQQILARLNAVLYDIVHAHQFMTLCCGILDRGGLSFEYANAGHPPPLLLRSGEIIPLDAHGLVLGVVDAAVYEAAAVSLQPDDVLVFYTDGVTEAVSPNKSLFGLRGFVQSKSGQQGGTAADLRDDVWSALQEHLAGGVHHDDRTLAVLRICRR